MTQESWKQWGGGLMDLVYISGENNFGFSSTTVTFLSLSACVREKQYG